MIGATDRAARVTWRLDAWLELAARLHAFRRFRFGVRRGTAPTPQAAVAGWPAAGCGDALWIVEGWAYGRARRALAAGEPWRSAVGEEGPRRWVVPLRCGAALAFAETGRRENGLPEEWRLLVWEAAGFLASVRHPWRRRGLAAEAAARGIGCEHAFWHGVGRGLYFAPIQLLPRRRPARPARLRRLAPPGRQASVAAGIALAAVLTNLERPEVVARPMVASPPKGAAASGAGAAMAIWRHGTGREIPPALIAAAPEAARGAARWLDELAEGRVGPLFRGFEVRHRG